MTTIELTLDQLVESDADDLSKEASSLPPGKKLSLIRAALAEFDDAASRPRRIKLLHFIQAALASMGNKKLPTKIGEPTADAVSLIVESSSNSEERRGALQVLALLALKARSSKKTQSSIWRAVRAAVEDSDPALREFAASSFRQLDLSGKPVSDRMRSRLEKIQEKHRPRANSRQRAS